MNFELLSQLIINGLVVGTLYGVVAMCFVLIYKSTRVVNFAQGEFLLIGAWTCWAMLVKFELPFYIGFPLTLAFMVVFGILLSGKSEGVIFDEKPRFPNAGVAGGDDCGAGLSCVCGSGCITAAH